MYEIAAAKILDRALEVDFKDGRIVVFEDCWLRDHCRCSTCYHADTFQRAVHLLKIPDATIKEFTFKTSEITILWDDDHVSKYKADFLAQFHYNTWIEKRKFKPILWRGDEVANRVAKVHVDKFLNSAEGAKAVFQSLLDHGVALIEECVRDVRRYAGGLLLHKHPQAVCIPGAQGAGQPQQHPLQNCVSTRLPVPESLLRHIQWNGEQLIQVEITVEATEKVCKALGGVQHTLFGGMWEFTTQQDHADTAYTNIPLAVHNDNTYFTEAAGLQILHCIKHTNGTGGNTILADGFYGATQLRDEFPDDFEFLTTFDLEAEYLEDGHHQRHSAPVIQLDKFGDIKQIRFNVYDRSAMAFVNREECRSYYRSLRSLSRYYENPENQWQFKLVPGTVMVMDNFRLLHGRTGFTGHRVLCGSYVSRSDWLDRARSLGLIS